MMSCRNGAVIINENTVLCSGLESSSLSNNSESRGISGLQADERIYSQTGLSFYEIVPLEGDVP